MLQAMGIHSEAAIDLHLLTAGGHVQGDLDVY